MGSYSLRRLWALATIAIVHVGFDGHAGPAARLGSALSRLGHDVIAWAPERFRSRVETDGVTLRPHEPTAGPLPDLEWPDAFHVAIAEGTERSLAPLIEELDEVRAELVVHDCQAPWGRIAAEFLGLPHVVSWPLFPPGGQGVPLWWDQSSGDGLRRIEASRLAIARRWGVDIGERRSAFLSVGPPTVTYTTEWMLGDQRLPDGWCCVGPLMGDRAAQRVARERPLVYVAFGTSFSHYPEPFRFAMDALADVAADVIVSLGNAPIGDQLGTPPANVAIHPYVDSRAVLAEAAVHVTHGGAGSVTESLIAGVPMVCVPLGSDHAGWSSRVQELGVGETVFADVTAIRSAVLRLLEDDRPRARAVALRERLLAYDGEARLRRLVDCVLARG